MQALTREENRAAERGAHAPGFQRCGVTQADGKKAVRWILLRSQVPSSELKEGGEKPAPQWKGEESVRLYQTDLSGRNRLRKADGKDRTF